MNKAKIVTNQLLLSSAQKNVGSVFLPLLTVIYHRSQLNIIRLF